MPRNGSGIYHIPPGTEGFPDTTIESSKYNSYIHDVELDLNTPRPVIAGGTGGTSIEEALSALHAETSSQVVTNYDTHSWIPGSFRSATNATGAPVLNHAFNGWMTSSDIPATPPINQNFIVYARDITDATGPTTLYIREKRAGAWTTPTWWTDTVLIAPSPPPNAPRNSLWWDNSSSGDGGGLLYVLYDDGNTTQWVIACPQPDISSFLVDSPTDGKTYGRKNGTWSKAVALDGDTMTGDLLFSKGASARWSVALNDVAESGADVGSDFELYNHNDAGVPGAPALVVNRATGLATVKADPIAPLGIVTKQYVDKETVNFYSLSGGKSLDIQVPAGKTTAIMNGVVVPTSATLIRLIIQLSLSPGIFETTLGDYAREGFYHGTAMAAPGIGNVAGDTAIPGMQVHNGSDNINYPTIFDGTLFLTRLNATNGRFVGDFRGRSYSSSAGWTHSFFYNHLTPSGTGSAVTVVAFRFTSLTGDNWGDGSYLSIIWK